MIFMSVKKKHESTFKTNLFFLANTPPTPDEV